MRFKLCVELINVAPSRCSVWDYFPAKSIAVTDQKIISANQKCNNALKKILHKSKIIQLAHKIVFSLVMFLCFLCALSIN